MSKEKQLIDIKTIDELKDFVGSDDLTEEEWGDLINFVLDNSGNRDNDSRGLPEDSNQTFFPFLNK